MTEQYCHNDINTILYFVIALMFLCFLPQITDIGLMQLARNCHLLYNLNLQQCVVSGSDSYSEC